MACVTDHTPGTCNECDKRLGVQRFVVDGVICWRRPVLGGAGVPNLFDAPEPPAEFDGETFVPERDHDRMFAQLTRVKDLMLDGEWRTLDQISDATNAPPASVSARLRDLRKTKFGGFTVERSYISDGLFQYRVVAPELVP